MSTDAFFSSRIPWHVSWGRITVTKPRLDEVDILIEFHETSLKARRKALAFAQALINDVREQSPAMGVRFVRADNHYHVNFITFASVDLKIAHELHASLAKESATAQVRCCCSRGGLR